MEGRKGADRRVIEQSYPIRNVVAKLTLLALLGGVWPSLRGQVANASLVDGLHLLAATPSARSEYGFGAELYTFDPTGAIVLTRTMASAGLARNGSGFRFVRFDEDGRFFILAAPHIYVERLEFVSMDSPAASLSRRVEPPDSSASWHSWSDSAARSHISDPKAPDLTDVAVLRAAGAKSLLFEWSGRAGILDTVVPLTVLGPGGPSRTAIDDYVNLESTGLYGLVDPFWNSDKQYVNVVDDRLTISARGGRRLDIGLTRPPDIAPAPRRRASILIRNRRMSVVGAGEPKGASERRLFVWTPANAKWNTYKVPGDTTPVIRPFGKWILGVVANNGMVDLGNRAQTKRGQSSGVAERRAIAPDYKKPVYIAPSGKLRPTPDYWMDESRNLYPGILFAIDTETGTMLQLPTGQGDSEVLAMRNDVFYYRVNDQLFGRYVVRNAFGPAILLAQHKAVPEMHWAFFE